MANPTATGASNVYDLISWAKLRNPDNGHVDMIAELLNQSNEQVQDAVILEGNQPLGHRITQRTGLPTTYTRQINSPVQVSRGQTAQIEEGLSIFETWAEYDQEILELWGEQGTFLYHQSLAYYESITEAFSKSFIYGDPSVDPTQFLGLAARYSTVNSANANNAVNVVDGGGTSNVNTSMYLVTWAPYAFHLFFPKGSAAGIMHRVKEDQTIQGSTGVGGTRMWAHQESWTWKVGAALWDWRWCGRLANIDTTNLKNQLGATDLTEGMIDLLYRMPSIATPASTTGNPTSSIAIPGKQVFYCNRTVRAALHKQMLNKTSNQLSMIDWFGHKVMSFMGIPIRNCDQILNTEAQVT
jgi:hypothetical protein